MGLDMYLSANRFFWFDEEKPVVDGIEIKEVKAEAAYWRKANQIHNWFVQNVQDGVDECQPSYVDRTQLETLMQLCQEVLDNPKKAETLLPTQSGFFFGGTKYDEWYFEDLRTTIKQIDEALEKFPDPKWDFEYRSSW